VLLVTAIVMNSAVIYICCWSGRRQEYVSVACYCNYNALRCFFRIFAELDDGRNTIVLLVTAIVMHCAVM